MAPAAHAQILADAEAALARGDLEGALRRFTDLEHLEPQDGLWPRRVAEVHARRGDALSQMVSLGRAVERYAGQGALLRALAACKQMMQLAPQHPATQHAVAVLTSPDVRGRPSPPSPADTVPPGSAKEGWASIPPGVTLSALSLAEIVPARAAHRAELEPSVPGLIEIDLAELEPSEKPAAPSLPETPLFSALSGPTYDLLVERMRLVSLPSGQVLFRQGEQGRAMYVISEGAVRVVLESPARTAVARLGAGEFFGEIALIANRPRTATIEAIEDTQLLEIDQHAITVLLMADPKVFEVLLHFLRDRLVDLLVRTSPLFARLSPAQARALTARFQIAEAKDGAALVEQGRAGRGLMIILTGTAEVSRRVDDLIVPIATLGPGDILGEMSLLSREPAAATVRARGRFIALELRADHFDVLMREQPHFRALVESVADERRRRLVEMLEGRSAYGELHLNVV